MGSEQNNADNLPPTVTLARLYEKQGFLDKAAATYKKLIAAEPYRDDLRHALEQVETRQGQEVRSPDSEPNTILSHLARWQAAVSARKKTVNQGQKGNGKLLVIHGQDLEQLGTHVPGSDGEATLEQIDAQVTTTAETFGITAETFQSDREDELIQVISLASGRYDALIINPAGLSRIASAVKDAVMKLDIPVIEVHLSNIFSQEASGQKSWIAEAATAHIAGFGKQGYMMAVQAAANMIAGPSD